MSIHREIYMCKFGFDLTATGKSDKVSFLNSTRGQSGKACSIAIGNRWSVIDGVDFLVSI